MNHLRTLDEPLIPGIRDILTFSGSVNANTEIARSSERFAGNTILRTLRFAIDSTLDLARGVFLRVAYIDAVSPGPSDFLSAPMAIGAQSVGANPNDHTGQDAASALDLPVNFRLPDQQGRLVVAIRNNQSINLIYQIRFILDKLGRVGGPHGRR